MADRKAFLVRLDPALHEALQRWADADLRSLNEVYQFLSHPNEHGISGVDDQANSALRRRRSAGGKAKAGQYRHQQYTPHTS